MLGMVIGGVVAVSLLALIIFPDFRRGLKVLAGGFLGIFIEDKAKTPEGARAVYAEAIREAQEDYNRADDTLKRFAGELSSVELRLNSLREQLKLCESRCESLVRSGRIEDAKVYSEQRQTIISEMNQKTSYVEQLKPKVEEAKQVHEMLGKKLSTLKRESKNVVEEMKLNQSMQKLVNDLDDLKRDSATDKMLGAVRDGAEEIRNNTLGSMVVHGNRTSTKVAKAERAISDIEKDDYLESLKMKYSGNGNIGSTATATQKK